MSSPSVFPPGSQFLSRQLYNVNQSIFKLADKERIEKLCVSYNYLWLPVYNVIRGSILFAIVPCTFRLYTCIWLCLWAKIADLTCMCKLGRSRLLHQLVVFTTIYMRLPSSKPLSSQLHPVLFFFVAPPSAAAIAWNLINRGVDDFSKILMFISLFLYLLLVRII